MATVGPAESFTFTVGKLDAGMAILLGERAHLIEFPSILLPTGATTGSIVNIAVHQNLAEEKRRDSEFWQLQKNILQEFGTQFPKPIELMLRNATQTSVTLEWAALQVGSAKLRSLDIYRNGQRLAAIPSPLTNTSTKLSGLEINTEYTFQLILRTSAGTFPSNLLRVRTHTMVDTSGICVCFGNVQDPVLLENSKLALKEMKAKWSDKIQIDTTHFVCTTPAATPDGAQAIGSTGGAPGIEYQRALQLSIPVVQPLWILACHREKKMFPIASYYLGASPAPAVIPTKHQSMSQASLLHHSSSPPYASPAPVRSSMPLPSQPSEVQSGSSSTSNQQSSVVTPRPIESTLEEGIAEETDFEDIQLQRTKSQTSTDSTRKRRAGTMNRDFKFPPTSPSSSTGLTGGTSPAAPLDEHRTGLTGGTSPTDPLDEQNLTPERKERKTSVITPSSIEVPPPPPVEKERTVPDDEDDDMGDTVDVPLN